MMRAMRVDKLTLAALEATVEIHLAGKAMTELPVLRMLAAEPDELRIRCQRLVDQLSNPPGVEIHACDSPVGGGSIPGATRPGFALRISGRNPDRLAAVLRDGSPAVQTRVTDDAVWVDVRTVAEADMDILGQRLGDALSHVENESGE